MAGSIIGNSLCDGSVELTLKLASPEPVPVEIEQGPTKTGIKLRINFKNNTLRVVEFKKRSAAHLDLDALSKAHQVPTERLAKYTDRELDAALALAGMRDEPAHKKPRLSPSKSPESATFADEDIKLGDGIMLRSNHSTRKQRIVDPTHPSDALLIRDATKAGTDIYDSDTESLPGDVGAGVTSKPELFRNVQWGPAASDTSQNADFPTEPEFDQFVPGRWERLADGTLKDQKHKLLVRLTTKDGRKVIFRNPPPKDWNNQKAITCLNKRISQQIRRNTSVRFRQEVEPYIHEERVWINENLVNGKPADGWKAFVADFNDVFAGKILDGCDAPRPMRTHSSLTKEVERFGKEFYAKGKVPEMKSAGKKGKAE